VLPVILVAVGSAYGIHVITHYMEDRGKGELDRESHRELVLTLVKKIAKPVFLAALTTFVGFLSFCFTTVLPIREFGFFASFGVIVSFGVAMTLIPSLLIIRGPGKAVTEKTRKDLLNGVTARFFSAIAPHKGAVLFISVLVMLVSVLGASRIIIDNVFVEYFKPDTDIYKSDLFIRERFGGSKIVSVVAEADSSEVLLSPACLSAMDDLSRYLETNVPEAGKTMGFTDLIKRINQVFNADESPEGLKPVPVSINNNGEFGFDEESGSEDFGFGSDQETGNDDFGFGNFGVDDAQEFGFGAFEKDEAPPEAEEEKPGKVYTLEELTALLSTAARSGNKTELSANELLNELKKLINYEGMSYYEIPANPAKYGKTRPEELAALVSNYLILLSGDIDSYSNDALEPTAIKTTVQFRTLGEADTGRALNEIYRFVEARFPTDVKVTVGGSAMVESSLNQQVVHSQLISVILSLLLVFLIITVSNRSLAAGLIGIAPLSISILINFAVMGFLGIKLNIGTSMIASLAVGIGIDYTIHYMEAFKREYILYGEKLKGTGWKEHFANFIRATFAISGKAIIINAVSVGAGFAVLMFSHFNMLGDFGLLIALTRVASAFVSLTVIPALLLAFKPKFLETNT
jgi:predicted RND superfamily exporter protein